MNYDVMPMLFDFQREDVQKLSSQESALIANEMGTGKTYEAIARDQLIRAELHFEKAKTLVIAPLTTLRSTWAQHFNDLTDLTAAIIDPKDRAKSWDEFITWEADVFIVHWEALRLMPQLSEYAWQHVIADECHRIKNRKAQQTLALKSIQHVVNKTAMSGTPVVNRPDELWSVLNWLKPKVYKSYWKFLNKYVEVVTEYAKGRQYRRVAGPKNLPELHRELAPFFVRRRKQDVLKDLPDKYYTEMKVDLTPVQRRAYNQMRDEMIAWIGEQQEEILPAPVVIAQLTRLQQFAVAYAQYDEAKKLRLAEPSSKLDMLMELISESDGQVVVFSRFKQLVDLACARFMAEDISYARITGDVPQDLREGIIESFQQGKAKVFIGTIAAGGIGITLTAASTVIFTDRDWSPALNLQAEDRLHRYGQKNAVQVIDIIARNTVDLGKHQALQTKIEWIRAILGDKP